MEKIRADYRDAYHKGGGSFYPVIIYQILNVENGKRWISETFNLDVTKYGQFSMLDKGIHPSKLFMDDYIIYGKKVFIFSVLEIIYDINKVEDRFQFFIDNLNPEYNYLKENSVFDKV